MNSGKFLTEKGLILILQYAVFENGHYFMIDHSISKLHIIRQKKDCTFRLYKLHLLKFCQFLKILNSSGVAFVLNTLYFF